MKAEPAYESPRGAGFVALDDQEGAVAVMLDFVNPSCTRGGMICCGCELRLDELQRHTPSLAEA